VPRSTYCRATSFPPMSFTLPLSIPFLLFVSTVLSLPLQSPFHFWRPAFCDVTIIVAILRQDVSNQLPSTILHFITQRSHARFSNSSSVLAGSCHLKCRIFNRHKCYGKYSYCFIISLVHFPRLASV